MTLFGSNREDLRRAYLEAWRKHGAGSPLTPLEALIADVIGAHPEYQSLLEDSPAALAYEPSATGGEENLFFHLGLHLAVREQLSIDRPPGVREVAKQLVARLEDAHDAEHAMMEALAETLWESQRAARPPDEERYLALARRRLAKG